MNPILGVNPDGYPFTILCPVCKERRSVSCSRKQVAGDGEVTEPAFTETTHGRSLARRKRSSVSR